MPPKKSNPKVPLPTTRFGFNKITKAEASSLQLENDLHAQQLIVTREREEQKRKDDISRAAVMATVVNSNMNVLQIEADNNVESGQLISGKSV